MCFGIGLFQLAVEEWKTLTWSLVELRAFVGAGVERVRRNLEYLQYIRSISWRFV